MDDDRGLALTTTVSKAAESYNAAVRSFLEYRLDASALAKTCVSEDPDFSMGQCLRGYLLMGMCSFAVVPKARAALLEAERTAATATPRERQHVQALRQWVDGDLVGANATWERIIAAHPLDIVALRMHHYNCFWMCLTRGLRATPASVVDCWAENMPGYGNLLGMLAFGLEENGEYGLAERAGRRATELNPDDLWALHSVAHVLEMQGRDEEGRQWLSQPHDRWHDRNPFHRHVWWHLALFTLASRQVDQALHLYDQVVLGDESDFYLDIQNAASLLTRLELSGANVGGRWKILADHAAKHIDDHALIFTDIHCVLSLAREKRFDEAGQLIRSLAAYGKNAPAYMKDVIERLGVPLSEGVLAFETGRYDDAVELILPLRHMNASVGASHAQRDLFDIILMEAAARSGQEELVSAMRRERQLLKSPKRIEGILG